LKDIQTFAELLVKILIRPESIGIHMALKKKESTNAVANHLLKQRKHCQERKAGDTEVCKQEHDQVNIAKLGKNKYHKSMVTHLKSIQRMDL